MDTRTVQKQALAGAAGIPVLVGTGVELLTLGTAWLLASRRSRLNRESS